MAYEGGQERVTRLKERINEIEPSVVTVIAYDANGVKQGSGSGFFIQSTKEGVARVFTNQHVIEGASSFKIVLHDGTEVPISGVAYTSPDKEVEDAAILTAENINAVPVKLGDSSVLERGDQVFAMGNPFGEIENAVTVGYVSAPMKTVGKGAIGKSGGTSLAVDININPGNSGGPLVDVESGEVIGVNTFVIGSRVGAPSKAFSLSINELKTAINHTELLTDVHKVLHTIISERDPEKPLSAVVREALLHCVAAIEGKEGAREVMAQANTQSLYLRLIKDARANRAKYIAYYEEIFGVTLVQPINKEEKEAEVH